MRTVTFSDPSVARYVNANFVCTWVNANPKFHNCEKGTERKIATDKGEIFATRNLGTYVLDRDGHVLHYFCGFYAPSWYLRELQFAVNVLRETHDETGRVLRDASIRYSNLHMARRREIDAQVQRLIRLNVEVPAGLREEIDQRLALFPDGSEKHSDVNLTGGGGLSLTDRTGTKVGSDKAVATSRKEHLLEGLRHLGQVHRTLASQGQQRAPGLPEFQHVRARQAGANPFAEE